MNSAPQQPATVKQAGSPAPSRSAIARFWWLPLITAGIGYVLLKPMELGVGLGLGLGVVLLVLLGFRSDRIDSPTTVIGQFTEPMLGQIPVAPELRGDGGARLLQHQDQRLKYVEAYRSLRSSLLFMGYDGSGRTLLVTSSTGDEGATLVASNLAVTFAEAGTKTLLIDANFGNGDLHKIFRIDGRTGLANVLRGELEWKAAVQQTEFPNLNVITTGAVDAQTFSAIDQIGQLLQTVAADYQLVVIDAAPVATGELTPALSGVAGGTLLVLRTKVTPARKAKAALAALRQPKSNILGLVLNCIDPESSDFSYNQTGR